ncbi:MAG: hypothetical protein HY556_06980 [Euryarchaeota archaeon]|nr:hypothetical protein [Euryarchaeota archaeon]
MRGRDSESGQLLLLAGILLVVAFIGAAMVFAEINALEKRAQNPSASSQLSKEYREIRERFVAVVYNAVTSTTTNDTLKSTVSSSANSIAKVEIGRGFDFVALLATGSSIAPKSELNVTNSTQTGYEVFAYNGTYITGPYDGVNDGIMYFGGRIKGAVLFLSMSSRSARVDETLVVSLV